MNGKAERPFDDDFVTRQRDKLAQARKELIENVAWDEAELLSWQDDDDNVDQHPADDATSMAEMELDLGLIANASAQLAAIDDALERIANDTYGWDEESGEWIAKERLEALPWARRTLAAQQALEAKFDYDEEGYTHDTDVTTL